MRRVWEVCSPHSEVLQGKVTEDSFVVNLGGIWERLKLSRPVEVDERYLNPKAFIIRTYFTEAMKSLIVNVCKRLQGEEKAQSVYHLRVGMGGGKSHTLLLLYYLVERFSEIAEILKQAGLDIKVPENSRVVIVDGSRISPLIGFTFPDGTKVYTPWGLLFKQLGEYDNYKELDTWSAAPTVDILKEVLSKSPTLILIDELTFLVENVRLDETKARRIQLFIQALTTAVNEVKGCALVVATPVGVYPEAYNLVAELLHRYSKDLILASKEEYKSIRRKALFLDEYENIKQYIDEVTAEFYQLYKKTLPPYAGICEKAILENYPFHPFVDTVLLNLKTSKAFQEVRDELRLLASLVYSFYKFKPKDGYMITTGHVNLADDYVRGGTVAKLQNPVLVARLDDDLSRLQSRIQDDDLRKIANSVFSTIVLSSLSAETQLKVGVLEDEIIYALITPDTSPDLIKRAIKECAALHFINVTHEGRWIFGEPSLRKFIDDYVRKVERDKSLRGQWWDRIRESLQDCTKDAYKSYIRKTREERGKPLFEENNIHVWPLRSEEINDEREPKLVFVDYLLPLNKVVPVEFLDENERSQTFKTRVASTFDEAKNAVKDFYESYGAKERRYKNTVFFLVSDRNLVERNGPIDCAKNLLALEQMIKDRDYLRTLIGDKGLEEVEEMKANLKRDLLTLCILPYRYLVYPCEEGLAVIELGEERRDISRFLKLIEEKLRNEVRKVIDDVTVDALLTRYWPKEKNRIEVKELLEGFFRRPELELITNLEIVKERLKNAVKEKKIAYMVDQEQYYGREPLIIKENGILVKEIKPVSLKIEAVNIETNETVAVNVSLDEGKLTRVTPFVHEDLEGVIHSISVEIPENMEFVGWDDGEKLPTRTVSLDRSRNIKILLKPKPPPAQVMVRIEAADISTNSDLNIPIEVNGEKDTTPCLKFFLRGSKCTLKINVPPEMAFEGWSDGSDAIERELPCDINTTLIAKLRPLPVGVKIETGSTSFHDAPKILGSFLKREAKIIELKINCDVSTFIKISGVVKTLIKARYNVTLNAMGGKKLGLEKLVIEAKGSSEKYDYMRGLITQLRDYLESVEINLSVTVDGFRRLEDILSEDSLKELKNNEGKISYRFEGKW